MGVDEMRERDGIETEDCKGCGADWPIDMLEYCDDCNDGPFCDDCLEDHEDECHTRKCAECHEPLEEDPPCPICKGELCEECFPDHVVRCKFEHELGKQQRLLTQFLQFDEARQ